MTPVEMRQDLKYFSTFRASTRARKLMQRQKLPTGTRSTLQSKPPELNKTLGPYEHHSIRAFASRLKIFLSTCATFSSAVKFRVVPGLPSVSETAPE
jgi:hypothetical protein